MKIAIALVFIAITGAHAAPPALRLVQTISLPKVEGRIDHMAVDIAGQRLFIAALGNNSIEVVDLKRGKRERSLAGFHEPQGLAWIPERNALFVASTCLAWVGFNKGTDVQTQESIRWLFILTFGGGSLFTFLVIPIALRYPISRAFMARVKKQLAEIKAAKSKETGELAEIEEVAVDV